MKSAEAAVNSVMDRWRGGRGMELAIRDEFQQFSNEALEHYRQREARTYDLIAHCERQREWSVRTFGPPTQAKLEGLFKHIRREMAEITAKPDDPAEYADLLILAIHAAFCGGLASEQIAAALRDKLSENEQRKWPDWRTADQSKPVEHIRAE